MKKTTSPMFVPMIEKTSPTMDGALEWLFLIFFTLYGMHPIEVNVQRQNITSTKMAKPWDILLIITGPAAMKMSSKANEIIASTITSSLFRGGL